MQFVVVAEHPPSLCPMGNATTRKMMEEGADQLPGLAKELGVDIITLRVFARITWSWP